MARRAGPLLAGVAILAFAGITRALPSQPAFFISALAILLFPGMALTHLVARGTIDRWPIPERLVVWFVVGMGFVAALGLAGLVLRIHLREVIVLSAAAFAGLAVILILKKVPTGDKGGHARTRPRHVWPVTVILLSAAVGLALFTLVTPRDYDDWYYLAYIGDYASGARLASEDAIFDMGNPVTPRIWFGGGWWVLEAMLARVSGVDPIACHQVYLPLLLLALVVLAVYALAVRLFRSAWKALLACGFQMLFYLSSAFPYKSTGWLVFARIAQDKAVACFIVAPVAAALGLRLLDRGRNEGGTGGKGLARIYWIVVFTSILIHGMGPVWVGLLMVPLALVEWLRIRSRASALALLKIALPILGCAAVLIGLRGLVADFIIAEPQEIIPTPGPLSSLYLPGMPFKLGTDTTNPITWMFRETFFTINPLFIMRYPIAIVGMVLTPALLAYVRSSLAARFMLALVLPVLFLLFTPIGIALAASFLTQRLVFRLVWILPWGLTVAFFVFRLRLRPFFTFLVFAAAVLAISRGNPANYGALFAKMHARNRPSPDAVEAFGFLRSLPSPQGVVLASEATGRMIPAFLPDAYPVNFREYGPVSSESLARMVERDQIGRDLLDEMERSRVAYILIENTKPLARALANAGGRFSLEYRNQSYSVYGRAKSRSQ